MQSIAGQMGQVMKLVLLQIFHSSLGSPTDLGVALQGPTVADNCRLFFSSLQYSYKMGQHKSRSTA